MSPRPTKTADSRDMIGAHDAFRHQFGALPGLIRGVADGDRRRAAVVAGHTVFLADMLHYHHSSEDDHVWPKLHERAGDALRPLIATMERQHAAVDAELHTISELSRRWPGSARAAVRDALAEAAERLLPVLTEHLALEEAEILPLIDRHLTDAEWKATVAASTSKMSLSQAPVALGMVLDRADAEMVALLRAAVPPAFWLVVKPLATRRYRSYARRVFATS